jgi:uncharacterized membrane protein
MSDNSPILPPASPGAPGGTPPAVAAMDQQEINEGRALAILSYIFGIVAIVMLFIRYNNFALFHAKQKVALVVCELVVILPVLGLFCLSTLVIGAGSARHTSAAAPGFLCLFWVFSLVVGLCGLVFTIIGIVHAAQGQAKSLPIVGSVANWLFGSLQKKPV